MPDIVLFIIVRFNGIDCYFLCQHQKDLVYSIVWISFQMMVNFVENLVHEFHTSEGVPFWLNPNQKISALCLIVHCKHVQCQGILSCSSINKLYSAKRDWLHSVKWIQCWQDLQKQAIWFFLMLFLQIPHGCLIFCFFCLWVLVYSSFLRMKRLIISFFWQMIWNCLQVMTSHDYFLFQLLPVSFSFFFFLLPCAKFNKLACPQLTVLDWRINRRPQFLRCFDGCIIICNRRWRERWWIRSGLTFM